MPHARCGCPTMNFVVLPPDKEVSERARATNSKTCDKCYCYVCDVLATECGEWPVHCMAFDRDKTWKERRAKKKESGKAAAAAPAAAARVSKNAAASVGKSGGASGGGGAAAAAPRKPKPACTVPGWTMVWSPDHCEWFYWNSATQVSAWTPPQV